MLVLVLAVALVPAWNVQAASVSITGIRTGVEAGRTRIVLDLDGAGLKADLTQQDSLHGQVHLLHATLGDALTKELSDRGLCRRLVMSVADDGVGIAIEATRACRIRCFSLENPQRLVIDIVPAGNADPGSVDAPKQADGGKGPDAADGPGKAESGRDSNAADVSEPPADSAPTEHRDGGASPAVAPSDRVGGKESDRGAPAGSVEDAPAPKRGGPRIVVIDAGHGGEDPGATAPGLREKDVCLDVARRVHKLLSGREGVYPILTRSRDVLVPLRRRMRLAEEANADLFVSIHVNSAPTAEAKGVEVFFLSIGGATDEAARELAHFENEADEAPDAQDQAGPSDLPFSLSLRQSDTLLRSSHAAETVLDLLVERGLAANRGVRQANFTVLRSYQVPSILVEIGFASSPEDREALKSEAHRDRLANAIAAGLAGYFETYAPVRSGE